MSTTVSSSGSGHLARCFGEFTLDLDRGSLVKAGKDVKLRPKSFEMLVYLAERPGVLVSKDELLEALWGQTVVTEDSVTHCLIDIRKAIGDRSHRMIRTVPRRGYIFDIPVTEGAGPETADLPFVKKIASSRLRWPVFGAALLAAVAAAALWWMASSREAAETGPIDEDPPAAPHSIAVLAFQDLSQEQDQAYLADGIAEEILNLLAKIPELTVISRSSAFSFRDRNVDIPTVARQLNVAHVLEGSVRRDGVRLRVSAQLIDARTDIHLWSETYQRELGDIFQIQDEIAASVAEALRIELLGPIAAPRNVDPEAYTLALQAKFFWNRHGPGDHEKAGDYYRRALEIAPGYAAAWAGLSGVYMGLVGEGQISPESGLAKAREAVEKALSLDPGNSDAHARMGMLHIRIDHDWEASMEERRKALALDPNNPLALGVMMAIWQNGDLDGAIGMLQKAVVVDPLTATWPTNLSYLLTKAGRLDEAEEAARTALDLNPEAVQPVINLATVLLLRGQFDEALERVRSLPEDEQKSFLLTNIHHAMGRQDESDAALVELTHAVAADDPMQVARAHAYRGEVDQAFEWLDRTNDLHQARWGMNEHYGVFKFDPFLESLHDDPRWDALLASLVRTSD